MTPVQWLTVQRLELAKQLLETTDLPVDVVAHRSGFGSGNSLRAHMRPAAYRRAFGAGLTGQRPDARGGVISIRRVLAAQRGAPRRTRGVCRPGAVDRCCADGQPGAGVVPAREGFAQLDRLV
jgi:hypothetical protein